MSGMHLIGATALLLLSGGWLAGAEEQPQRLVADRRLVAVNTAASNILVLVFHDHDENPAPSAATGDYSVNGREPLAVGRVSATLYEERCTDWSRQRYPQLVEHRMYLAVPEWPAAESSWTVSYPGGATNFGFRARELRCESFKVNQVGYHAPAGRRAAFFAPWCGDLEVQPAATESVWLCDAATGREVRRLALAAVPADGTNGGPCWRIDLTGVERPGEYFLLMAGVGRSPAFGYGDVYAHHAFYVHLKGLYHQRCGVALQRPWTEWERPACHRELELTDAAPPDFIRVRGARRLQRAGGHHDAGDFDVRLAHTVVAGWLLNAFELFPDRFTDRQLDLPESGNGIPDLLDEALFSIRGWSELQEEDGGIRAGFEADRHPTYGEVNAATDTLVYRTFARYGHTTLAGAALMTYAARLVAPFDPARSEALLERADRAWAFYTKHAGETNYHWSAGALMFAAGQRYLATGDSRAHEIFQEQAEAVFGLRGRSSQWPAQYHGTYFNLKTIDQGAVFTHYFISYLLDDNATREKNPAIAAAARRAILGKAEETLRALQGPGFATMSTAGWGASTGVGRYGDFLMHAYRLTGEQRYWDGAARLADWALGANPAGRCFTSGLGTQPPWNPLQLDSYEQIQAGRGPVPGLVVYGVTEPPGASPYVRAVTQHLYPPMAARPPAWRYTDGWSVVSQNEFTVWETMAPNAFLHACLAPERPLAGRQLPYGTARPPGGYPRLEPKE